MPFKDMANETDAQLMALVKLGDMPAFGRLYQKYGELVNHAILSTAPSIDRTQVEDLCQDVFLAIHMGATRYREEGKLKSWIYSFAVRSTKERRRKWAIRGRLLGLFKGQRLAVSTTEPAAPDVGAMLRVDMGNILEQLPEAQRQVLILFEKDGLKGEEIAQILDMNVNTVWTHLRRARAEISRLLHLAGNSGGAQ